MVWGAIAAVAGGAILQGLGNEKSARSVRRNARRQMRYLDDYSKAKLKRSKAFANSMSHIGDDYMDQVSRYYNARNSSDRSDRGRAAYAAQEAKTVEQAGDMLNELGIEPSRSEQVYTRDLESADISPYKEVMNIEAEFGAEAQFGEEAQFDLFRAGQEIETDAREIREDFQLKDAEKGLENQRRMQDFQLAAGEAARSGDLLTGAGSVLQAGGMVSAMF